MTPQLRFPDTLALAHSSLLVSPLLRTTIRPSLLAAAHARGPAGPQPNALAVIVADAVDVVVILLLTIADLLARIG